MNSILRTEGLEKTYRKRAVLSDFSMQVAEGEFVGLFGPNGSGKTTTFKIINGLVRADAGSIFFCEQEVSYLPTHKRARLGMGYLSQEPAFFRLLSVYENLRAVLQLVEKKKDDMDTTIRRVLNEVGLAKVLKQKAFKLSGGEKRRLELAIMLCFSPKLVLLDEPFVGVDPLGIQHLKELILNLRNKGISVVITDHNIRDALTLVDRAYILHEGTTIFQGTAEDLKENDIVRDRFLGEEFTF